MPRGVFNGSEDDKKFTWAIKNFSPLQFGSIRSKEFVIDGCKWYLMTYPTEKNANYFSPYLVVADFSTLPSGWKRHIKCRLTIVNQLSDKLSKRRECWLDRNDYVCGCPDLVSLTELDPKKGGFVVNDEIKIVVKIDVLEVVGKLDVLVSKESQEGTQPLKRTKFSDHGAVSSHLHNETSSVDVNGFQVLASQAESVKRIFEKHPDMALEFRAKNQHLRTSCINVLLILIETLCQPLQDISIDDLSQAEKALTYLKDSGFKIDWLETKLEQVKTMKMEEQIGKTRMQELEEELKVFKKKCSYIEVMLEKEKEVLKDSKQKCSDIEAMMEKEYAKVLAATRAPPLTLDDVVQ